MSRSSPEAIAYQYQIRYLGGLLSGYDLLTGPYKDLLPRVSFFFFLHKTSPLQAVTLTHVIELDQTYRCSPRPGGYPSRHSRLWF